MIFRIASDDWDSYCGSGGVERDLNGLNVVWFANKALLFWSCCWRLAKEDWSFVASSIACRSAKAVLELITSLLIMRLRSSTELWCSFAMFMREFCPLRSRRGAVVLTLVGLPRELP